MDFKQKIERLKRIAMYQPVTTLDLYLLNLGFETSSINYSENSRSYIKTITYFEETQIDFNRFEVKTNNSVNVNYQIHYSYESYNDKIIDYRIQIEIDGEYIVKTFGNIDYEKGYNEITQYLKIITKEIDIMFGSASEDKK